MASQLSDDKGFHDASFVQLKTPLLQLTIPLVSILKLDSQLSNFHEGKYVRDPLNDEGRELLLIRQGLANLQESLQFMSLDPRLARDHSVLVIPHSWQRKLVAPIFVLDKSTSHFEGQIGRVEYLLDVQYVDNGPGVLCECAKGQSVFPDKCSG